ncbi:M-phase inducer phosphatase 1-B isoform X1 [Parasteatoda tepidariorum]|nr:M-phase inducer phosphatase 1-B isoform X1 [Parasteatoda tepidariorum]XP_042907441.1 M-phase inducer phosphatase 1-B isoform X2 [Parasteatoda tepidariorum]
MDKRGNKENRNAGSRNMKITSVFKVKKCLFDSNSEFKSPQSNPEHNSSPVVPMSLFAKQTPSPNFMVCDDSPFSQFNVRKRRMEVSAKNDWNRSTPNRMDSCTTPLKRSSILIRNLVEDTASLTTASPENSIKLAVQKSIQNPDLIGDFSKPCVLPVIDGKHPDLKTISPDTVANLLQGSDSFEFTIIDCRYPYEYAGGHIKNALNIYYKGDAEARFFSQKKKTDYPILIFYCEFSSERAPSMMRFLRSTDRNLNRDHYPHLFYPELYVMEGGYKAFYSTFEDLCEPQSYKPMLHEDYSEQMSHYRTYCKNYSSKNKRRRAKTSTVDA